MAKLTAKAFWMPASIHCFNDTSNYNVTAFIAVGSEEDAKVFFAILSAFKLVKNAILESPKALGTNEALKRGKLEVLKLIKSK